MRQLMLLGTLVLATGSLAAQELSPTPAPPKVNLTTDADRERFLIEAAIVRRRSAPGGITGSERATLRSADGWEHDAHIQRIDQHKMANPLGATIELDFHDSYRNNVAAYRLDRLIGLGMVPVTVVRDDGTLPASFTWWVDDVVMDEKARHLKKIPVPAPDVEAWNRQMWVLRVFDQLIYNFDRNLGNVLIAKEWRIWMIDHTRAFKHFKQVKTPKDLGPRIARELLAGMRRLDEPTLRESMKDLLAGPQINGLLARRDWIVKHYDAKIAQLGEAAVLYDLPTRVTETAGASR
jgi:hypothetical protein